ncbi:MAG: DUF2934 domain-containing protein [Planctomycetota bacterium]
MSPRKASNANKTAVQTAAKAKPAKSRGFLGRRAAKPTLAVETPVQVAATRPAVAAEAVKPKAPSPLKLAPVIVDRDEIAARAYAIWETLGRPQGQDFDHWRQAEREAGIAA